MDLKFDNPQQLKQLLENSDRIDFEALEKSWYVSVRNWSQKDIVQAKIIVDDYHWKLKRKKVEN